MPLSDVWDIPYLNPKARERVGYPTQKPLLLLERVIGLSSNPNDRILDPFCGSGTTLVAGASMQRAVTGIDVSKAAIELSRRRLATPVRSRSKLHENGRESYRTADQSVLKHLVGIDFIPVHRNSGIDAVLKENLDGSPITLRVQREGETLLDAAQSLYRASVIKGTRVMFLVAVKKGGAFAFASQLPPGVICIESSALQVGRHLSKLADSGMRTTGGRQCL